MLLEQRKLSEEFDHTWNRKFLIASPGKKDEAVMNDEYKDDEALFRS